ncbi:MAG: pilus assembly FimT family protein [Planctomycetota bacterium]
MRKTSRGFTLIEILVVVVIMAIAAMLAVPLFSSAGDIQLQAAADLIAADLEYAKSMSITLFDKGAESYSVREPDGTIALHPVNIGSNYEVNFSTDSRLNQVDIFDVSFDGGNEVKFDSIGNALNASGGSLASNGTIILHADGETKTVQVKRKTGYISII